MTDRRDVAAADIPRHRDAGEAEREHLGEIGERGIGAFAAARRVGNDADLVAARRLAAREVANMPEQSADRRAKDMQDVESVGHRSRFVNAGGGLRWTGARQVTKSLPKIDH